VVEQEAGGQGKAEGGQQGEGGNAAAQGIHSIR
jgi:hypothetical protein